MDLPSGSPAEGVRVELYVRSLSPRESRSRIERVVERLDRLVDEGALAGYRVVPTGAEFPATQADAVTDYGAFLLGRVAAFEEWASGAGHSLGPLVERRTVFSQFTGEDHDALVMPTMILAEYEGTALRFVAPCDVDDERVTALDRLDVLSVDEQRADERLPGAGVRQSRDPTTPAE